MDPSEAQLSSSRNPQNLSQNPESQDIDMNGTRIEINGRNEGSDHNESEGHSQQDATLPDAPQNESALDEQPPSPAKKNPGPKFLDYLTSPAVELIVGHGDNKTVLAAHQTLLLDSPMLAESIANFNESSPRRIHLPDENVEALSCFLQFKYTNDYAILQPDDKGLSEQATGEIDYTGELLLKHARVYTLAEKLGIQTLKTLAHSKIHHIKSSAHGEIVYARYVYTNTPAEDVTIRKPVAAFWATRSHVLRHEAENGWKRLCLEIPEFSFDVLSLVLDQKEKHSQEKTEVDRATGTKRPRRSSYRPYAGVVRACRE